MFNCLATIFNSLGKLQLFVGDKPVSADDGGEYVSNFLIISFISGYYIIQSNCEPDMMNLV